MPSKAELEKMIKDCMDKKGWSYDHCKKYIAGGIWGGDEGEQNDMKVYTIEAVPVLKTGNWTDMYGNKVSFTMEDLDEIVRNTNALLKSKILEPPLKLGHNEKQEITDGMPSIGYISQVYRLGNQIFADFANVPQKIYDLIKAKAYSKISAEVYMNFEHPETGENIGKTIRAVALLGADVPAIKGLGDILSLYKAKENIQKTLLCFSEKELKSKKDMEVKMKTWKIEDIKELIKCDSCIEAISKFMAEENKTEITTEDLAVYLTKMRMAKLEDDLKDNEIVCPEGYEWNGIECVSKTNEAEIERHICPKGYKWDDEQKKCIPIEIVEEKIDELKEKKMKGKKDDENKEDENKKEETKIEDIDFKDKEKMKKIIEENKNEIENFKFEKDKRPPKGWFDKCVSSVSDITDTPEQLCGWIYYHHMTPERRKEIETTRQEEQETKMSENPEVIALKEKIKELTNKEMRAKFEEIKKNNRDILIPALDEYLEAMFNYFSENPSTIKFKEDKVDGTEMFLKFLNKIVNAKRVIFSEISKTDETQIKNILNTDDTLYEGNTEIRNIKLAKLAEIIEKKENITYAEALKKASKMINERR